MRNTLLLAVLVGFAVTAVSQNAPQAASFQLNVPVRPLITQPLNESQLVTLKGNTHPMARPQFDLGAAPPSLPLERMLLVLKRSPEQETALATLLDQQQDKSSPNFHRWLTPDEFGSAFGPSDADVQIVTGWLQTHGFQVARVARGRTVIEFSGTHVQLQQAFHTSIHKFAVNGEEHWANASDPQIPAALEPVVAGVHTLHNFLKTPNLVWSNRFKITQGSGSRPEITGTGGQHFLGPGDFAKIYNIPPTLTGVGATIGVVGRSNVNLQDINDFRAQFGVPTNIPTVVLNGGDPGDLGQGEEAEAMLDSTWSSAVAPNALVKFVVSASTDTTDGVDLSELYIIDNNLTDVMTESFSTCEANASTAQAQAVESLAAQASAQGITYILSTGDTGSAGCAQGTTLGPVSVSLLASTRFNVAVGGTQFNDNPPSTYWGTSQSATVTALSYIPENVWNETSGTNLAATGGGVSIFFAKPTWQTALTPPDGFRDLPDISFASAGHTPYLICLALSCSQQGFLQGISGTSAAAPSFAGIMALINQQVGSRQGLANYVLYKLAATQSSLTTCNGSSTTALPAANCIFNDVTVGNNDVPGEPANKYNAGKGYDLATGLGSVNVANLASAWNTAAGAFKGSTTTLALTPSPVNIPHGTAVNVQVTVVPSGTGTGTPTGTVSLLKGTATGLSIDGFLLPVSGQTTKLLPGGNYSVLAHYPGDGTFGSSNSAAVAVTVTPENSSVALTALTFDSTGKVIQLTSTTYGNPIFLKADVSGLSGQGTATGSLTFNDTPGGSLGSFPLNSQGEANTAQGLFNLAFGPHSVSATYPGDASFNTSSSSALPFTITKATTTTAVQASASNISQGGSVTLTANITTTSGGNGPSGTVTFLSGGTPIGTPQAVSGTSGSGNIQSGAFTAATASVSFPTTALPLGTDSITAVYNGDGNYSTSTSTATVVNVANFNLATNPSPGAVTIASPGKSGTLTLNVTGQAGFTGTVSFACSGLPSKAACSFNPTTVTGNGTATVSTTVTVTTTAPSSAMLEHQNGFGWWTATSGGLFAGVFLIGVPSRRRHWSRLLGLAVFGCLLTGIACGGGSSSGPPPITNPGTPLGSFNAIVTGTSTTGGAATTTFTLTVN